MNGCMLLLLTALTPAQIPETTSPDEPRRPLYEIHREVRALCQQDSQARTDEQKAASAFAMSLLYRQILEDPRLATSSTLQSYRGRLWSRLTQIKKDAQQRLRKEAKSNRSPVTLSEADAEAARNVTRSLGDHLGLIGASLGGPARVFHQAGAAGGRPGPPDYGPDLVDLIQRTIQPEFWDVHGGPGTIVYYRPLHCLVVRATSEVHHQVGGVVSALRAAGR